MSEKTERNRDLEELKKIFADGFDWQMICETMLDNLTSGVALYEVHPDSVKALYLNGTYYQTVGCTEEEFEARSDNVLQSLYPEYRELVFEKIKQSLKTGKPLYAECLARKSDGNDIWLLIKASIVDFIKSSYPVALATVQDITERKRAQLENAINVERYRVLEATSRAVTFEYDLAADIMFFWYGGSDSKRNSRVFTNYRQVSKRTQIVHPEDYAAFTEALAEACAKPVSCAALEYRTTIIDQNNYKWARTVYSSVADSTGRIVKVLGKIADIDEEKSERQRMIKLVETDATTGLLNKLALATHIQDRISESNGEKSFFAIVDIDDFKAFNDTYGHSFGDEALKSFGGALKARFENALVGRFGGDEFIVFDCGRDKRAVVDSFNAFMSDLEGITIRGKPTPMKCSIGVVWGGVDKSYADYFDGADELLYKAKNEGKCRICYENME